jgi:hypothetical protein
MRVFAKKQRDPLSVVPRPATQQRAGFEVNDSAVRDSFHGWLHSVAVLTDDRDDSGPAVYRIPRLTALDVSRVNQATIREGESHCIWPPSVLRQFHKAEVITETEVEHYVLRDVNLTRVANKRRRHSGAQSPVLQMLAERD